MIFLFFFVFSFSTTTTFFHSFVREDRVVGVAVVQFSEILKFKTATQQRQLGGTTTPNTNSDKGSIAGAAQPPKNLSTMPNGHILIKLDLLKRVNIDDQGWTLLRILGQRAQQDSIAREFIQLKSARRLDD